MLLFRRVVTHLRVANGLFSCLAVRSSEECPVRLTGLKFQTLKGNFMANFKPRSLTYFWPWIDLDATQLRELWRTLMEQGVKYGYGFKASPISVRPSEFSAVGSDGKRAKRIDCSGMVRYAFHLQSIDVPDGSVNQHDWAKAKGFKKCKLADVGSLDGRIRLGFLSPQKSKSGIGHVFFVLDGRLFESHGSTGPDNRRAWGSESWHSICDVYVVNPVKR